MYELETETLEVETPEEVDTETQDAPETVPGDYQDIYDLLEEYLKGGTVSADPDQEELTLQTVEPEEEEDILITHGADIAIVMLLGMIFGLSLWGAFSRRFFA